MVNLSRFDGKSLAVVLNVLGREVVWPGIGSYQVDSTLGNVLRIRIGEPAADGGPEFLIQEAKWRGRIVDGSTYGCDYAAGLTLTGEN